MATDLCSFSKNKKHCGKILNIFCQDMLPNVASNFIYDLVSLDFFYDLKGKLKHLLKEIPDIQNSVKIMIESNHTIKNGNIIDSDEDANGNLK